MANTTALVHGRKSSLSSGVVSNIDFVLLQLASGPQPLKVLRQAFRSWRGVYPCQLFSREYNFISKSATDLSSAISGPCYSFGTNRTTYWYKVRRGVYSLNQNGMRRLANLLAS